MNCILKLKNSGKKSKILVYLVASLLLLFIFFFLLYKLNIIKLKGEVANTGVTCQIPEYLKPNYHDPDTGDVIDYGFTDTNFYNAIIDTLLLGYHEPSSVPGTPGANYQIHDDVFNFEDKNALCEQFYDEGNRSLVIDQLENIGGIDGNKKGITNTNGIQYLKRIELLNLGFAINPTDYFNDNVIGNLDLSKNTLLRRLYLIKAGTGRYITESGNTPCIDNYSLDVSNNPNLRYLNVYGNTCITNINFYYDENDKNTTLRELNVSSTPIINNSADNMALDFRKFPNLESLKIESTQNIRYLDLSENPNLRLFDAYNSNILTIVNDWSDGEPDTQNLFKNNNNLETLILSNATNLCAVSSTSRCNLDLSAKENIQTIKLMSNQRIHSFKLPAHPSQLSEFNFSGVNNALIGASIPNPDTLTLDGFFESLGVESGYQMGQLKLIRIGGITKDNISFIKTYTGTMVPNLTSLRLDNMTMPQNSNGKTSLDFSDGLLSNLESLTLYNLRLNELDISNTHIKNVTTDYSDLYSNGYVSACKQECINNDGTNKCGCTDCPTGSGFDNCCYSNCSYYKTCLTESSRPNKIEHITLNSDIETISMSNNNLQDIDLSPATSLVDFNISNNPLTNQPNRTLSFEHNTNIKSIDITNDNLRDIELPSTSNIETILAKGNSFDTLNLSGINNNKLKVLRLDVPSSFTSLKMPNAFNLDYDANSTSKSDVSFANVSYDVKVNNDLPLPNVTWRNSSVSIDSDAENTLTNDDILFSSSSFSSTKPGVVVLKSLLPYKTTATTSNASLSTTIRAIGIDSKTSGDASKYYDIDYEEKKIDLDGKLLDENILDTIKNRLTIMPSSANDDYTIEIDINKVSIMRDDHEFDSYTFDNYFTISSEDYVIDVNAPSININGDILNDDIFNKIIIEPLGYYGAIADDEIVIYDPDNNEKARFTVTGERSIDPDAYHTAGFDSKNLYTCILKNKYNVNNSYLLTDNELAGIKDVVCPSLNITSAKGLQKLPNLENLILRDNKLTTIDFTNNLSLKSIDISNNKISSITGLNTLPELQIFIAHNNSLPNVNLSGTNKLEVLMLQNNPLSKTNYLLKNFSMLYNNGITLHSDYNIDYYIADESVISYQEGAVTGKEVGVSPLYFTANNGSKYVYSMISEVYDSIVLTDEKNTLILRETLNRFKSQYNLSDDEFILPYFTSNKFKVYDVTSSTYNVNKNSKIIDCNYKPLSLNNVNVLLDGLTTTLINKVLTIYDGSIYVDEFTFDKVGNNSTTTTTKANVKTTKKNSSGEVGATINSKNNDYPTGSNASRDVVNNINKTNNESDSDIVASYASVAQLEKIKGKDINIIIQKDNAKFIINGKYVTDITSDIFLDVDVEQISKSDISSKLSGDGLVFKFTSNLKKLPFKVKVEVNLTDDLLGLVNQNNYSIYQYTNNKLSLINKTITFNENTVNFEINNLNRLVLSSSGVETFSIKKINTKEENSFPWWWLLLLLIPVIGYIIYKRQKSY